MLLLSPTFKSYHRLIGYRVLVRGNELFRAKAVRFLSSSLPSGDSEVVESSSSSSSDDGDYGTCSNNDGLSSTKVLFPWRHRSTPVSRLIPGTPEYKNKGLLLTSKSQKVYGNSSLNAIVTAYMFLNVPWYELIWFSYFQDELSSNVSWSFTQGVASLLSNIPTYGAGDHIPLDRIITERGDETCEIDFREIIEITKERENGTYCIRAIDDNMDSGSTDSNGIGNIIPLRGIFQEKVIELYRSSVNEVAKRGNNDATNDEDETKRFELRLKMTPYDCEFITLYAIPYLSRRNAVGDPDLLTFYSDMLNTSSTGRAPYLSQLRQEHLEKKGYMESTIIAQCLVWCEELFYVKDLETNKILQGREKSKEDSSSASHRQKTPHLVRMERTVVTKRGSTTGKFENEQEDWIITDIDDLLGGNLVI